MGGNSSGPTDTGQVNDVFDKHCANKMIASPPSVTPASQIENLAIKVIKKIDSPLTKNPFKVVILQKQDIEKYPSLLKKIMNRKVLVEFKTYVEANNFIEINRNSFLPDCDVFIPSFMVSSSDMVMINKEILLEDIRKDAFCRGFIILLVRRLNTKNQELESIRIRLVCLGGIQVLKVLEFLNI